MPNSDWRSSKDFEKTVIGSNQGATDSISLKRKISKRLYLLALFIFSFSLGMMISPNINKLQNENQYIQSLFSQIEDLVNKNEKLQRNKSDNYRIINNLRVSFDPIATKIFESNTESNIIELKKKLRIYCILLYSYENEFKCDKFNKFIP